MTAFLAEFGSDLDWILLGHPTVRSTQKPSDVTLFSVITETHGEERAGRN